MELEKCFKTTKTDGEDINDNGMYLCRDCDQFIESNLTISDGINHLCPIHPLQFIPSKEAESPKYKRDFATLPSHILHIAKSFVHGYGVFAKTELRNNLFFGPYQGERLDYKTLSKKRLTQAEKNCKAYDLDDHGTSEVTTIVDAGDSQFACWLSLGRLFFYTTVTLLL